MKQSQKKLERLFMGFTIVFIFSYAVATAATTLYPAFFVTYAINSFFFRGESLVINAFMLFSLYTASRLGEKALSVYIGDEDLVYKKRMRAVKFGIIACGIFLLIGGILRAN